MGQDPGLSLALGSVPVNLTNMTQAYSTFAEQGALHPATTIIEIRDRNNRVVYTRDDNGPETTHPMTKAEAYLPHYILEGNTDPARNLLWGERAQLVTPDGQRRPAGFKTGTTNDFRDVSGFGYVPGSLTTGVWMGNNNQEPMSNEFSGGLFSADGPLFLWHDFMELALNQPWAWNDNQPVGQTSFPQPEGIVNAQVCRWSRHGRDGRLRHHDQPAVPRGHGPGLRQRPPGRLPRPGAVRVDGSPDPATELDHRGRYVVRPGGQRADRRERGSRQLPDRPERQVRRSRRSTASPASRPSAASVSPGPARRRSRAGHQVTAMAAAGAVEAAEAAAAAVEAAAAGDPWRAARIGPCPPRS